ncbi:CYTH domain-containing protein [Candidatus Gracilibacteria bacterium]|nr:CYTH domain-containing protein [Candidatus Gracilibacteria bacterium]
MFNTLIMALDTGPFGLFQGQDSDESTIIKDILSREGAQGIIRILSEDVVADVNLIISQYLQEHSGKESIATITSIGGEIKKVVEEIEKVLKGKIVGKYFRGTIKPSLSYRLYINWVLEKLQHSGFIPQNHNYKDVPTAHGEDIFNILQDKALTSFFMVAKSFGLLDFSENQINTYEEENEIKVLDTSAAHVSESLFSWQEGDDNVSIEEHEEVSILDEYYDDENLRLDRQKLGKGSKRSLRIRTKTSISGEHETFYTIKRKIDESQTKTKKGEIESRKCFEKEFEVNDSIIFGEFLGNVGLKKSREKSKKRKSYSISFMYRKKLVHAKLDIDNYENGIPEFLEIECDDNNAIKYIIKKLKLQKKQLLTDGSRGLFDHYGLDDQYKRYYNVDGNGSVEWNDGNVGNINASPAIRLRA